MTKNTKERFIARLEKGFECKMCERYYKDFPTECTKCVNKAKWKYDPYWNLKIDIPKKTTKR